MLREALLRNTKATDARRVLFEQVEHFLYTRWIVASMSAPSAYYIATANGFNDVRIVLCANGPSSRCAGYGAFRAPCEKVYDNQAAVTKRHCERDTAAYCGVILQAVSRGRVQHAEY